MDIGRGWQWYLKELFIIQLNSLLLRRPSAFLSRIQANSLFIKETECLFVSYSGFCIFSSVNHLFKFLAISFSQTGIFSQTVRGDFYILATRPSLFGHVANTFHFEF